MFDLKVAKGEPELTELSDVVLDTSLSPKELLLCMVLTSAHLGLHTLIALVATAVQDMVWKKGNAAAEAATQKFRKKGNI